MRACANNHVAPRSRAAAPLIVLLAQLLLAPAVLRLHARKLAHAEGLGARRARCRHAARALLAAHHQQLVACSRQATQARHEHGPAGPGLCDCAAAAALECAHAAVLCADDDGVAWLERAAAQYDSGDRAQALAHLCSSSSSSDRSAFRVRQREGGGREGEREGETRRQAMHKQLRGGCSGGWMRAQQPAQPQHSSPVAPRTCASTTTPVAGTVRGALSSITSACGLGC